MQYIYKGASLQHSNFKYPILKSRQIWTWLKKNIQVM